MKLNSKTIHSLEKAINHPTDLMVKTYGTEIYESEEWAIEHGDPFVKCKFIVGIRWNQDGEEVGVCYELLTNGKFNIILWDLDFTCETEEQMLNYIEQNF